VKYAEARGLIESGDLIAFSHRGWGSWYDLKIQAVRAFTRSEFAHVGTAWVVGGRVFVIEAVMPKVRIYPLSKMGEFYLLPMGVQMSETALEFALEKVGEGYSQRDAICSFFRLPNKDDRWQCAELARDIAMIDGVTLGNSATPTSVVHAALKRGASLIFVE